MIECMQNVNTTLQALLTGLSVMMPHDPWEFVLEKLQQLKDSGGSAALMHWSVKLSSIFQTKIITK